MIPALGLLRAVPLSAYAVIAALGWGAIQHHRAAAAGAQLLAERGRAAELREAAYRDALLTTTRRLSALQETTDEAIAQAARDRAAAAAAAADRRVRERATALVARAAAADPAAADGCAPAANAARVLADLLRRADERAGLLARIADERGTAGRACERLYDSLTGAGE